MIKNEIGQLVQAAVRKAQEAGDLPAAAIPDAPIERPQRPEHGDYGTGLAMRMARAAQMNPLDIAKMIAKHIDGDSHDVFAAVEVAPPGFINFRLSSDWLAAQVDVILAAGPEFGNISLGAGKKVQVEFVSANPVGPIHVGNGRGLALGDTLARALAAAGFEIAVETNGLICSSVRPLPPNTVRATAVRS